MGNKNIQYDASSIETLSFRQAIRTRISMYLGSADNNGVLQAIREIITNSIDEATMGFGDKIEVELFPDNRIRVSDAARGVPFGTRADGTEALEAIYTMPHTGGKFSDKTYQNVAGMNGIGSKGTALSSVTFSVDSYREGAHAHLELENGIKTKFEVKQQADGGSRTGTVVEFVPSPEVFNLEPIYINFNDLKKMCRDWSYLCKGISFVLTDHTTGESVTCLSKNGLLDFMRDAAGNPIHRTPLHMVVNEENIEAEIVLEWTDNRTENWHVFTNGLENPEGGTSLTGIKTSLTNFFKKKLKDSGAVDVARKGLFYAVSCKVPHPSFSDQRKSKVNNPELRGLCQRATTQMLENFEMRHKDEFESIINLLSKELRAEAAAERARKQVLEAGKEIEKNQRRKVFATDKLKDAEFLGENSILLICEGDSSMIGMAQARTQEDTGLLAIRGKLLNCLSHDEDKIFQNEEIKLLLSAMNIVPGKYDHKKLRYGRIGICSDADSDGYHIGLLIMAALARLAPEFIKEGRLCWLRSPLFILETKKKRYYYFNDEELAEAKKIGLPKGELHRAKGLGALTPEEAHESMFTKEFQRLEALWPDEETFVLLYDLMGEKPEPRAQFIFENIDFSQIRE